MPPTTKTRILLLEDTEAIRNSLAKMLTHRGYEVFSFSNPMICPLQIMPDCRCNDNQMCADIIVTDMDMPCMTGLKFIENQRIKNCKCPHVVLMSSYWKAEDLSRAHELGCKILTKPFSFNELYEWMDEVERNIDPARELFSWFEEQI